MFDFQLLSLRCYKLCPHFLFLLDPLVKGRKFHCALFGWWDRKEKRNRKGRVVTESAHRMKARKWKACWEIFLRFTFDQALPFFSDPRPDSPLGSNPKQWPDHAELSYTKSVKLGKVPSFVIHLFFFLNNLWSRAGTVPEPTQAGLQNHKTNTSAVLTSDWKSELIRSPAVLLCTCNNLWIDPPWFSFWIPKRFDVSVPSEHSYPHYPHSSNHWVEPRQEQRLHY